MTDPCVAQCGRPASTDKDFCGMCWARVPLLEQRALYVLSQQIRFEPNNGKHQVAYELALGRAVKKVPA